RPDLGIGELAAGQGAGQAGQGAERARDAYFLACGAWVEADAPAQPLGAGAEAIAPTAAGVELADEVEQARGGGFEVRGELGDLVAEAIELGIRIGGNRAGASEGVRGEHVHAESPPAEPTLHRDFGGPCVAQRATIASRSEFPRQALAAVSLEHSK